MKTTRLWLGAVLGLAVLTPLASAQRWPGIPQAPDACAPGFYCTNYCGAVYGPNYCVRPPYPPFNGMILPPWTCQPGGGPPGALFSTHPYARSPRDFFMME